jgi:hypothetical protein
MGLGSENWNLEKLILDPGYRIQGSKKHRIPNPEPQLRLQVLVSQVDC